MPPLVGQVLQVHQGQLVGEDQWPLHRTYAQGQSNAHYVNIADGRFLYFELEFETNASCYTHLEIRAAFGSSGADSMTGIVMVDALSTCLTPMWLMPKPSGHFAVELRRAP
jgi:hypothetical protein